MAAAAITLVGQSLFKVLLANRWGGALHRETRSGSCGRGHLFEEVEGRKEGGTQWREGRRMTVAWGTRVPGSQSRDVLTCVNASC